jgi:hypothetical protein
MSEFTEAEIATARKVISRMCDLPKEEFYPNHPEVLTGQL